MSYRRKHSESSLTHIAWVYLLYSLKWFDFNNRENMKENCRIWTIKLSYQAEWFYKHVSEFIGWFQRARTKIPKKLWGLVSGYATVTAKTLTSCFMAKSFINIAVHLVKHMGWLRCLVFQETVNPVAAPKWTSRSPCIYSEFANSVLRSQWFPSWHARCFFSVLLSWLAFLPQVQLTLTL